MPTSRSAGTASRLLSAAGSAASPPELLAGLVAVLRRTLPVDGWCAHTLDPATALPTGADSGDGYLPELVPRLLEIEYQLGDVNAFDELLQRASPVGDLQEATAGRPETSPRYRDVVRPSGFGHELRVVFRHQARPWGALVLLRASDAPAFTARDRELLASVSEPVAAEIKRLLLQGYADAGGTPDRAGLLILGGDLEVETASPAAAGWLRRLGGEPSVLPLPVVALASRAVRARGGSVRGRARGSDGQWLTVTAWSLGASRTAVTLEPTAPHDLTALALDAYSLSPREREIVELVLLGHSTAQIGQRLFLSPYTVQDHLKAIFDKTGVRSRRELAADLFFGHYLPRIERGTPLDANGWFDTRG